MKEFEVDKPVDVVTVYTKVAGEQPKPEIFLIFGAFVLVFAYVGLFTIAAAVVTVESAIGVHAVIGYMVEVGGPEPV